MPSTSTARKSLELSAAEIRTLPSRGEAERASNFVDRYGIQITGTETVWLTVPAKTAVIEIVLEAQSMARALRGRDLVGAEQLETWSKDRCFTDTSAVSKTLWIQGFFPGSLRLALPNQLELLRSKGLVAPRREEFVAGAVAGFIAAGRSLFRGYLIRTEQSTFCFGESGLLELEGLNPGVHPTAGIAASLRKSRNSPVM